MKINFRFQLKILVLFMFLFHSCFTNKMCVNEEFKRQFSVLSEIFFLTVNLEICTMRKYISYGLSESCASLGLTILPLNLKMQSEIAFNLDICLFIKELSEEHELKVKQTNSSSKTKQNFFYTNNVSQLKRIQK